MFIKVSLSFLFLYLFPLLYQVSILSKFSYQILMLFKVHQILMLFKFIFQVRMLLLLFEVIYQVLMPPKVYQILMLYKFIELWHHKQTHQNTKIWHQQHIYQIIIYQVLVSLKVYQIPMLFKFIELWNQNEITKAQRSGTKIKFNTSSSTRSSCPSRCAISSRPPPGPCRRQVLRSSLSTACDVERKRSLCPCQPRPGQAGRQVRSGCIHPREGRCPRFVGDPRHPTRPRRVREVAPEVPSLRHLQVLAEGRSIDNSGFGAQLGLLARRPRLDPRCRKGVG